MKNHLILRLARIGSLLTLGLTFFVAASLRQTALGVALLMSLSAVLATFLVLWQSGSTRAWWLGAGLWGGLSYISPSGVGLVYLIVAALTAFSAFQQERESRRFEFVGPLAFIVAMGGVIIVHGLM